MKKTLFLFFSMLMVSGAITAQIDNSTSQPENMSAKDLFKGKKKQQPTSTANIAQPQTFSYIKEEDPIYMAYFMGKGKKKQAEAPLFACTGLTETPLAMELEKQTATVLEPPTLTGNWATTLRHDQTLREMLLVKADVTDGQQVFETNRNSALMLLVTSWNECKSDFRIKNMDERSFSCEYEFTLESVNLAKIRQWLSEVIAPFAGNIKEANLADGAPENTIKESELFTMKSTMTFTARAAKYTFHGSCDINVTIQGGGKQATVLKQQIPCTFYPTADEHDGFILTDTLGYEVTMKTDEKKYEIQKEKLENMAARLADARHNNSAEAYLQSAELLEGLQDCFYAEPLTTYWKDRAYAIDSLATELRLAQMEKNSVGHKPDYTKLYDTYQKFSARGMSDAYYELAVMSLYGLGCERKTYATYQNAMIGAKDGSLKAMRMVADMYFTGSAGVRQDFASGMKWITAIAETIQKQYENK